MHASKAVQLVEKKFKRDDLPRFKAGDRIKVHARIKEGTKERIQIFEGTVLKINGNGSTKTFTVRKISGGIGVEIVYPICSTKVSKITVVSQGKVRRSRIYYLRKLKGKAARLKTIDPAKKAEA